MFHPATVIQSYWATSCRFGLEALNIVSTQSERPNVIRLTMSAVQRNASFRSLGMKNKIKMPTNGKKIRRVRGCKRNSMFYPLYFCSTGSETLSEHERGDYFKIKYPTIRTTPNNTDNAYERTNPFWILRMVADNHCVPLAKTVFTIKPSIN